MRRRIGLLAAAVFLVAVIAPAASADTSTLLFKDFFDKPATSVSNWTSYGRETRIADGKFWVDGWYLPDFGARDGWTYTHAGDTTWTDYTYDVTFDLRDPNGWMDPWTNVMLFARVADPTVSDTNQYGTGYRIDLWGPGQDYQGGNCDPADAYANGWIFFTKNPNPNGEWIDVCDSNLTRGVNSARIVMRGAELTVFVNGRLMFSWTDPDPIPYGGVGFGKIWEMSGSFDKVMVRAGVIRG